MQRWEEERRSAQKLVAEKCSTLREGRREENAELEKGAKGAIVKHSAQMQIQPNRSSLRVETGKGRHRPI